MVGSTKSFAPSVTDPEHAPQQVFPKTLLFLRHGQTRWNQRSIYQGSRDIPLHAMGMAQAKRNGLLLRQLWQDGTFPAFSPRTGTGSTIISSPLERARHSALIMAREIQGNTVPPIRVETDMRVREVAMGRWEGLTSPTVKELFPKERKRRKTDPWNFEPDGGESMARRLHDLSACLQGLPSGTVIVTHFQIIRMVHHLLGGFAPRDACAVAVPHVGITVWNDRNLVQING